MDNTSLLDAPSGSESEGMQSQDGRTCVSIAEEEEPTTKRTPHQRPDTRFRRTVSSNAASSINSYYQTPKRGDKLARSVTFYVRRNSPEADDLIDANDPDAARPEDSSPQWGTGETIEVPHEVFHEAAAGAVHGVVNEAVQQAVAAAIEDGTLSGSAFDWHANVFTLLAITGVVLFWRGLWTLWDQLLGLSIISNSCCLVLGLTIITVFRLLKVPLLESLPGG